jgi:hypothetical protein
MDNMDEVIRARAYAIWEQEGCPHGRDLDHWQRARSELNAERAISGEPLPGQPVKTKRRASGIKRQKKAA